MANPYIGPVNVPPGAVGGDKWYPNISAATVVKNGQGRCARVSVITAGSTAGAIYDNNSTSSGNTASTQIGTIPNTVGTTEFEWPCGTGITVVPGTGQVVAVAFE